MPRLQFTCYGLRYRHIVIPDVTRTRCTGSGFRNTVLWLSLNTVNLIWETKFMARLACNHKSLSAALDWAWRPLHLERDHGGARMRIIITDAWGRDKTSWEMNGHREWWRDSMAKINQINIIQRSYQIHISSSFTHPTVIPKTYDFNYLVKKKNYQLININCSSQIYQMTYTVIINHKLEIKVAWNMKLLKLKLNKIKILIWAVCQGNISLLNWV